MIDFVFDFGFVEKLFVKQEEVHVSRMVMVSVICSRSGVLRSAEVRRPGGELRS